MNQIIALNQQIAQEAFFGSVAKDWQRFFNVEQAMADVYVHIKKLPSALTPENHTEKAYSSGLKSFLAFLNNRLPTPRLMDLYIAMLRQSGKASQTIASKYLAPARLFLDKLADTRAIGIKGDDRDFAYDCQDQIRRARAVKTPRADETSYESRLFGVGVRISKSKVQSVLRYILTNTKNTLTGSRDYAIHVLAFSTGLRIAEIQRLTQSNFYEDENEQWWIKVRGKRSNVTPIPVDAHIKFLIDTYVEDYNHQATANKLPTIGANTPLWQHLTKGDHIGKFNPRGLTCNSLADIMGKWSQPAIGIKLAPHDFRRTFATICLKDGWDIAEISKALRHNAVSTTAQYIGTYNGEIRKVVKLI